MNRIFTVFFIIAALFVIWRTSPMFRESFEPGISGTNLGFPNKDPDTIAKLNETIIEDPSMSNAIVVGYNDIATQKRGNIRPFNESNIIMSNAIAESNTFNADAFGNTYYQLWESDQRREAKTVHERADEIMKTGVNCLEYKNVNQCMSVCDDMDTCQGFYIDSPGRCCIMVDPPYVYDRDRYNKLPNNTDVYAQKTVNEIIRREKVADAGKVIFDYVKDNNGNGVYRVNMTRQECKKLCPKCIMGRCPRGYRCTDMTADPRYNQSCIITNEDRYDETVGNTFDNPSIPYLDEKYGLDQYAGYDMNLQEPVVSFPNSDIFHLDAGIVPSRQQLDRIYKKYDDYHIGPYTYGTNYDISEREEELNLSQGIDEYNAKLETVVAPGLHSMQVESDNPDFIAIRGGNDPTSLQAYQVHRVQNKYEPHDVTIQQIQPKQIENFRMLNNNIPRKDQMYNTYCRNQ